MVIFFRYLKNFQGNLEKAKNEGSESKGLRPGKMA